jgi:hypothetical protein
MTDYKQYSGKTVHVIFGWNDVCGRVEKVNCECMDVELFDCHDVRVRFDKIKHIEEIKPKTTMTQHEHDRVARCLKIKREELARAKKGHEAMKIKDVIEKLERQLVLPVVEIDYKGEFNKVDNPFV